MHAGYTVLIMHVSADRFTGPFLQKADPVQVLRLYLRYRRLRVDDQCFAEAAGQRQLGDVIWPKSMFFFERPLFVEMLQNDRQCFENDRGILARKQYAV